MSAPDGGAALTPATDDPDTQGFFQSAADGSVAIRTCHSCGARLHMPRAHCRYCGSDDGGWDAISGRGTLYAWSVAEHQVHPSFPVPYTVVLVAPDDAPNARLVGYLPGRLDLTAGQPMRATFQALSGDAVLPQWEPIPEELSTS